MGKERYYASSFIWSTLTKALNALVGFISVPLLIKQFGRADYGILTLALSFNAYMHLLDLGMNTGAVRFFSILKSSGETKKLDHVARTNLSFYSLIAVVNIVIVLAVAFWGEGLFSITHEQFMNLRWCLCGTAVLSLFSWTATAFNQLLVADFQMAFTMKMSLVGVVLKIILIIVTLKASLSLPTYFFLLTLITASLIIPFSWKCLHDNLLRTLRPAGYWKEFKPALVFSLAIFALSFFQMTATESRPLVLGIFVPDAADALTDYKIISVVPMLIITIGGTLSGIFLPNTSELVAKNDRAGIERFAYKWTRYTSILANLLCVPFILCAKEVICAYVGSQNAHLSIWMIIWCVTVLLQIHTTPGNSLVLAFGKTKALVLTTAVSCFASIALNAFFARQLGVGSAVLAYFIYVVIIIGLYYVHYYKSLLDLSRKKLFSTFILPTLAAIVTLIPCVLLVHLDISIFGDINERLAYILICLLKTAIWIIPYVAILLITGLIKPSEFKGLLGK
ncbi:MAG: polysaccharide biosynthesis C-terminal domain-containing protein [Bacteroidales bacterium]|nr:polysaccharide biosynthesis C-terminal domain-containing protein [Bacteroidales bacterium]